MKKRILIGLALLLAAAAAAFFLIAPGMIERDMNKVDAVALKPVSGQVADLHSRLLVADMHADTLLWSRSLTGAGTRGQVDLPRLEAGNVALQVFSSVTKTPKGQNYDSNGDDSDNITLLAFAQLQPPRTWFSLVERSLWHSAKLHRAENEAGGRLRIVRNGAGLRRLLADRRRGWKVTGALLSVEGLHNLEGDIGNLDRLRAADFRMAGLVHFFDNELGGSMHGVRKGGLTPFGRKVVRRMEELGMIVDVAHASPATVRDVLAMARRPVVSSHGGVQATCKVNRNLSDEQIKGIAATGGVIGIGYWDAAVCGTGPEAIADAILHVKRVAGIDHVALGSDFDGAVTTGFDTSKLAHLTQALADRGFTDEEISKVMGDNLLGLLERGMRAAGDG
jgi:microsomal dipeptidase-like Zn-dependent dipeptidase